LKSIPIFKSNIGDYYHRASIHCIGGGGDGATRPLPRDGGAEELHEDPTVGPRPKIWTRGQKWKKWCRRWRAGELGCGIVKEEVSQTLQRVSAGAA